MKALLSKQYTKHVLIFTAIFVTAVLTFFVLPQVHAATGINTQLNFQGKLVDSSGLNVSDTSRSVVFSIYDVSSGGTALWSETQSVTTTDGIFRVALGSSTPFPANFNFNWDGLYLGVKVASDSEMTPRIRLTAVPYAFNAQKVAGLTVQDTSGNASSSGILQVANGKTVTFGDAFSTTVGNSIALTTSGTTTLTLPTTGTLITLAGSELLTNKSIGSTGLTFSGATTDVTTGTNEDFILSPNGTGKISFGTTSPLGYLTLEGKATGKALSIFNQLTGGDQDLFTASQAGTTKFTIGNNGNIAATGTLTGLTGLTLASGGINLGGTLGTGTQCLLGGSTASWATCPGGSSGTNYWQSANAGAISPFVDSTDVLVGSTATSSAMIRLAAASGQSSFFNGGNVGIGTTTPNSLLNIVGAGVAGGDTTMLTLRSNQVAGGTQTSLRLVNSVTDNGDGYGGGEIGGIKLAGLVGDGALAFKTYSAAAGSMIERLRINNTGNVGIGSTSPLGLINVDGAATGKALAIFNQNGGDQAIFTASKSGVTKFLVDTTGNVGIGTTNPTDKLVIAGGSLVLSSDTNKGILGGGLSDCASSGNRLTWNATTNQFGCATDKPYLTVRKSIDETVNSLTVPQDDDELKFTIGANETWIAQFVVQQNSGTVPDLKFAVSAPSGATCDVSINDTISNTNNVSNLGCGVSQAVTGDALDEVTFVYATIVNGGTAGTVTLQWSQNTSDAGNTSVLTGSTVVATNISGANLVNMSSVPDWTVTGGTIFPRLATSMDLLIGGNSTASAKFAFINVSNGTPTASIGGNLALSVPTGVGPATQLNILNGGSFNIRSSVGGDAGLTSRLFIDSLGNVGIGTTAPLEKLDITGNATMSGNLTLNSVASIQTTKMQSLTIGGSTTGTVLLQANNSSTGKVQVGTGNGGTTTPDLFGLDVKSDTGDPTGFEGAMYYNTADNKFRCYQNTAWTDCITAAGGGAAPDTAMFTDANPAAWNGDVNTVELFNDATKPNIVTDSTSSTVLVSLHIEGSTSNTANDTFLGARLVYTTDGNNPSCSTSAQVGEDMISSYAITTSYNFSDIVGTFIHTPGVAGTIKYTVCSSAAGGPTQSDTAPSITVALVELGADLAENYYTNDSSIQPGHIVSLDSHLPAGVQKSTKAYDPTAIGVVSTDPGITLDDAIGLGFGRAVPVALSGRVPIKVTTENGIIKEGDMLTSSSIPGVAMKATKAGRVIAQAMTGYDGKDVGVVLGFVNTGAGYGASLISMVPGLTDGNLDHARDLGKELLIKFISEKASQVTNESSIALSELLMDRVAAGLEIITPRVITQEIQLDRITSATGSAITVELGENGTFAIKGTDNKDVITFDNKGNAFFAGTLQADKIKAKQIEGLEFITTGITNQEVRIKDLESWFASSSGRTILADRAILGASDSAVLNDAKDLLDASSTTQNESVLTLTSLQVDGLATVSGNLRTKGSGLFEGMLSVVDTLTTHNLIVSGISTFFEEVIFKKHVTFEETPVFTPDTAGVITIEKGNKKGDIRFSKPYEETPIIQVSRTAIELTDDEYKEYLKDGICTDRDSRDGCQEKADLSTLRQETPYIVSKKSKDGFSILLQQEAATRLQFSWTALTITKERKEVKVVNY